MSPGATMLDDGLQPEVSRELYDRSERVNFSTLKWMHRSPAHYRHVLTTPAGDSDAKKVGRVVHLAAFEPERFRASIAVWDGGTRRGKAWDDFCLRNECLELLTESEFDRCVAIQRAVQSDATAMRHVQGGKGEVTICWTLDLDGKPVRCKGRMDFVGRVGLTDLKSTKDASPWAFGRQAAALGYPAQAAFYTDGYEAVTGEKRPYVMVAVENVAPHLVQVYTLPERVIEHGRQMYREWLSKLLFCRSQNFWPGYSDGTELELQLPPWELPFDETDATGIGVEFDTGA